MSANGPGQFGGYTPPPPPPSSKKSPWLYVGLGCGALILLSFGGCVLAGVALKNTLTKPVDLAAAKASMGDTPVYPGSKLDETFTRAGGFVGMAMKAAVHAETSAVAGYSSPDPISKVFPYFESQLKKEGYTQVPSKSEQIEMFQKSDDLISVQQSGATSKSGNAVFWVMRFHGPNMKVKDN